MRPQGYSRISHKAMAIWIAVVSMVPPICFVLWDLITGTIGTWKIACGSFLNMVLYSVVVTTVLFYFNTWVYDKTFRRWPKPFEQNKRLFIAIFGSLFGSNTLVTIIVLIFNSFRTIKTDLLLNLIIITIITLIVSLWFLGKNFIELWKQSVIEKEQMEKENIRNQLTGLQHQLSPHFLFNSFNALQSLIEQDKEKAQKFVRELSGIYRYTLENASKPWVTLEEEWLFIQRYLYLQQVRFGNHIQTYTDMTFACMSCLIPPLSLQVVVENAIKHNIVSASQPLVIRFEANQVELMVSNNLQPRDDAAGSTGIGLDNLHQRYQLLSTEAPTFGIQDKQFIARLPLITPQ